VQPLIGITAGEVLNNGEAWAPSLYGQAHTYIDAVTRAGGIPFIIPFLDDEAALRRLYDMADAIVFSGGNDVDPELYGSKPSGLLGDISRRRDNQEWKLYEWSFEEKKPILAICRGMQLLNVFLGGTLHQDIVTNLPEASNHRLSDLKQSFEFIAHKLKIDSNSKLASILGATEINANTLHHQAIDRLATKLKATAWSEDGIIEAVELPGDDFIVGVQCHPEALEHEAETGWRNLFNEFVVATKQTS
jgi:putative glutamine amidotransferase